MYVLNVALYKYIFKLRISGEINNADSRRSEISGVYHMHVHYYRFLKILNHCYNLEKTHLQYRNWGRDSPDWAIISETFV